MIQGVGLTKRSASWSISKLDHASFSCLRVWKDNEVRFGEIPVERLPTMPHKRPLCSLNFGQFSSFSLKCFFINSWVENALLYSFKHLLGFVVYLSCLSLWQNKYVGMCFVINIVLVNNLNIICWEIRRELSILEPKIYLDLEAVEYFTRRIQIDDIACECYVTWKIALITC